MNIAHEKIREELVVDTAAGGELPISQVDYYVKQQYPSASVSQVQNETLATIRSLADDGLIVLGAMSGEGGTLGGLGRPGRAPRIGPLSCESRLLVRALAAYRARGRSAGSVSGVEFDGQGCWSGDPE
jgi:hypothetical protein